MGMQIDKRYRPELCVEPPPELAFGPQGKQSNLQHPYFDAEAQVVVASTGASLLVVPVQSAAKQVSGVFPVNALRAARKATTNSAAEMHLGLESDGAGHLTQVMLTDGNVCSAHELYNVKFPSYRDALPDLPEADADNDVVSVQLNPLLLQQLAIGMGVASGEGVRLTFRVDQDGRASSKPGIQVQALIPPAPPTGMPKADATTAAIAASASWNAEAMGLLMTLTGGSVGGAGADGASTDPEVPPVDTTGIRELFEEIENS